MGITAALGGIVDAIGGAGAAVSGTIASGAEALGASAGLASGIGSAGLGALTGAGLGAAEAGITGGNVLKGAEFGGLTGGAIGGISPLVSSFTGASPLVADTLVGLGAGAGAGALTGQGALSGAIGGGLGGAATGLLSGATAPAASAPGATPVTGTSAGASAGGVGSAASTAAPTSIGASAASASGDVTAGLGSNLDINQAGGNLSGGGGSASSLAPSASTSGPLSLTGSTPAAPAAGGAGSTAATSSGTAAAAAGGSSSWLGKAGSLLTNPATLIAGGGLAYDVLKGNQQPKNADVLQANAGTLTGTGANLINQGATMEGYLQSGTLPQGLKAGLDTATASAEASVRSQYASRGMSGSSAEAQDLANVKVQAQAQSAQIATQLFNSGLSETSAGLNAEEAGNALYQSLMNTSLQQDQLLSQGVSNFATAIAAGSRPVTSAAA